MASQTGNWIYDERQLGGGPQTGDWFAQNGPSASPSFATPELNQIAAAYAAQGYEPTQERVAGWGTNIDQRYLDKIRATIAALPKGDWSPTATQATTSAASSTAALDWNKPETWTKENINAYAASRGVTDPNFADYWLSKKDELFQRGQELGQPDYAFKRLSMADEFGGPRYGGDGAPGTPGNQQFSFQPWTDTFNYQSWQQPTGLTEENDPGFQARMKLGADALQRSAAARGTVLDTGTLRDLNQYAQDYASNEYDKVVNRSAQSYLMNRNNAADIYNQRYQQYKDAFGNALTTFGTNFGVDTSLWNRALTESNTGFQRYLSLADLGLAGTQGTTQAGQNAANQGSEALYGYGNAGAAGTVGAGNAWASGLGDLANYGSYYAWNRMNNGYNPRGGYGVGLGSPGF